MADEDDLDEDFSDIDLDDGDGEDAGDIPADEDSAPDSGGDSGDDSDDEFGESGSDEDLDGGDGGSDGGGDSLDDLDDFDDLDLDDLDFDDDDDFGDDDEGGGGDKKKWLVLGVGLFLIVSIITGAGMFILGGGEEEDQVAEEDDSPIPVVNMAIPPKKSKMRTGRELLKPPSSAPKKMGRPQAGSAPAQTAATSHAATSPTSPAGSPQAQAPRQMTTGASQRRGKPGAGLVVPSVTAVSYRGIPLQKGGKSLAAPEAKLSESGASGPIPRTGDDGRQAWRVYASPFTGDTSQPRISIIFTGLGLSRASTMAAIKQLPAEISLSFNPYARNVADWVGMARSAGHETLMSLPMEPSDFPVSDPGPYALQTDMDQAENIERLKFVMGLAPGNIGMLQMMGSRFVTSEQAIRPVLEEIRNRGLLFVGRGQADNNRAVKIASAIALPRAGADMKIDSEASRATINRNLAKLEVLAQKNKIAVALAEPYPVTISYISRWVQTLPSKKLILAPISAVAQISGVVNQEEEPQEGQPADGAQGETKK